MYALFDAYQSKGWPATDGPLFAMLCATSVFVPFVVITGLGHLRLRMLVGWTLIVVVLCVALAYYDIVRDPVSLPSAPRNLPSPQFWFGLSLELFIAQSLLIAGAGNRRFIANYATYFDTSWKYGLQIILAGLFAGAFWLLLWLGAELFTLIKIDALAKLLQKSWFWIPATTLILDCAIHITDVRVGIVRGVRTLSCNLLSWLLPLMTLIVVGFVLALPFTGLEPLWNTGRGSGILLAAAASLIFLINAAYHDRTQIDDQVLNRSLGRALRLVIAVASIALVPLVVLAAYAIGLRVMQYGWTPSRVMAAASTILAVCYAVGYAIAVADRKNRFASIEIANILTAFTTLLILLALLTPVADPARIAVDDQIRRLNTGLIQPDKFDYQFLRFSAGRYGMSALGKLAQQDGSTVVAGMAADALKRQTRYDSRIALPTAQDRAGNIAVVRPPGTQLPPAFLQKDWNALPRSFLFPTCLTGRKQCDAILADVDGDGSDEIILFQSGSATVFTSRGETSWHYIGTLTNTDCPGAREALLAGRFDLAPSRFKDLNVDGHRVHLNLNLDCTAEEWRK